MKKTVEKVFKSKKSCIKETQSAKEMRKTEATRLRVQSEAPLFLNLGIDFGTRFTKVCYRDTGRDKSGIVSFSMSQVPNPQDAMLHSSLMILKNEKVMAAFTDAEWCRYSSTKKEQKYTWVDFIKMRLANLDWPSNDAAWKPQNIKYITGAADIEALCAFYLACVIDRSKKWISEKEPALLTGRAVRWSANVGVPVQYCDSPALQRFERVLKTAWLWAEHGVRTTMALPDIKSFVKKLRRINNNPETDCFVMPEIIAAVQSFLISREARDGIYTYFDIGAGTLDGVSFRFFKDRGSPKVSFYSGQVKPLGISAIADQLSLSTGHTADVWEEKLISTVQPNDTTGALRGHRKNVQDLVAKVVVEGKTKDPLGWNTQGQIANQRLPVFIGGGGANSAFYRNAIESTYYERQWANAGIPVNELVDVPIPADLDMSRLKNRTFNRFAIAYGLSVPPGEWPEVRLPESLKKMQIRVRQKRSHYGVTYEETRDAYD